jgi:uncharacterized repeat protein (TIGR01451 family)
MREAFGRAITVGWRTRGLCARACVFALLAFALFGANDAGAQAITRFVRDTGNINFVTTGGSIRTQPNGGSGTNPQCQVGASSSQNLSGIPAGTTIRSAYLYWGGSGTTNDTTVTFNGNTITASRTFNTTVPFNSSNHAYFGDFADVTSIVAATRNGTYTLSNLTVSTGNPWCGNSLVTGGWSLIVIYESPTERLRAINVFDGMDFFYGSALTTTPDGFRVPPANIDGRLGVFTLDGDPGNSDPIGAFSESLRYNGTLLDDGIVVAGSSPATQQFDGTINTQGISTSYGIDVDQYDISALLTPGQTSGTIQYSAGGDVVVLMAQVVSATSDPAVDLSVVKSHSGNFISGTQGVYTITVSNAAGVEREDNTVTVTDTLPAGLQFVSGTGTGWTCGAAMQVVTCTHPPTLNAGASFPPITLTVNVLEAAAASVTNTVTVSSASFDASAANNTDTDPTTTIDPDLSTSTKTVVDVNGGEASPGDTLRYTVTLTESAGAQAINVVVTDSVPVNTTFGGFVSIPAGATSAFAPAPAGNFNLGLMTVSGITVPASGSVTVVFDLIVGNASPGATIDNEADVANPNGPDATPNAPQVVVTPSQLPSSGTKQLYVWSNPLRLSRIRPTGVHPLQSIAGNAGSVSFTLNPALVQALTLNNGNFAVNLLLARTGSSGFGQTTRNVTATLTNSSLGTIDSDTISFTSATETMRTFTLTASGVVAPVGSTFTLTVSNNSANNAARTVSLNPYNGTNFSRVDLNSATVINVDSVQMYNAAFNGGAVQTTFYPGANVFIRAQVSDPFGSFDISGARITITNPSGTIVVPNVAMTAQGAPATCNSQTAASCIFQYQFPVPASPVLGTWNVSVTADEGVEGVTDNRLATFIVEIPQPSLTILKTSTVLSDPVNNTTNPKRIPQAIVRYDITTTNSGPGVVDANTLVITDPIPTDAAMYVLAAGNPVVFVNGSPVSGLTFNYATNVSYSLTGVAGPFTYTPSPDADGFDPLVRAVRIAPGGTMNAAGGGNPSFTLQFRVRIN